MRNLFGGLEERRAVALGERALHLRRAGQGLGVVHGVVLELLAVVGRGDGGSPWTGVSQPS